MKIPEIRTERLRMRAFRNEDLDAYAAMCADPVVMKYIGPGSTQTRFEAWRAMASMLGHWQLRGFGMWALEKKDTGELVGRAGFIEPEGWPGFEIGWLLARQHWGHGYATEAARAALAWGHKALGRDRAISLIVPGNKRSAKVATGLGHVLTGHTKLFGRKVLVYEWRAK